ncbi:LuxR C-terminal-related transcriptional regulator [uncultured Sunxiuqinia sp.]|uniref:helix-turn-helix transcriptional regulator n=1 Tax=uncultured Sunxiuqinia sp. TaxID=1573825 RepID=UPI002AA79667|nr:LuxR C-terminal-related transcriptional regulator [uncultured Sunxiuqinia sp.]
MDQAEKEYFEKLKKELSKSSNKNGQDNLYYPLMPLQYSYIHDLRIGRFVNVHGVKNVLGYEEKLFTLDLYYKKLHEIDRKLIFNSSMKNLDTANLLDFKHPFETQFAILFRIKNLNNEYRHIFRLSTILEYSTKVERTFSICTDVTAMGLSYRESSHFSYVGDPINGSPISITHLSKQKWKNLSEREFQVLQLIADGKLTKEIADILHISKFTVNKHRQNIIRKNSGKSIPQLLAETFNGSL